MISVWTQVDCDVEGCAEHFRERGHKAWSTMMSSELGAEWRSLYSTYMRRFFCPDHRPQYEEAARARDAQVATERYRLVPRAVNGWRWVKLPDEPGLTDSPPA